MHIDICYFASGGPHFSLQVKYVFQRTFCVKLPFMVSHEGDNSHSAVQTQMELCQRHALATKKSSRQRYGTQPGALNPIVLEPKRKYQHQVIHKECAPRTSLLSLSVILQTCKIKACGWWPLARAAALRCRETRELKPPRTRTQSALLQVCFLPEAFCSQIR